MERKKIDKPFRFERGNKFATGRRPGVPNKVTTLLKVAIVEAAAMVGNDGKGDGGLHGYLAWLAVNEPAVFGRLLEKILPMQLSGKLHHTMGDRYETMEDLSAALAARGLPSPTKLIDVTPQRKDRDNARSH